MYHLYELDQTDFVDVYDAWANAIYPDDRDAAEAAVKAAIDGIKPFDVEFRIITTNGRH